GESHGEADQHAGERHPQIEMQSTFSRNLVGNRMVARARPTTLRVRRSGMATATSVHDLDLPEVDFIDVDRREARTTIAGIREQHWLARTPLGYVVTRHDDVTAILRDKRWHSALSLLPQMGGIEDEEFLGRRPSILSMEG